MRIFKSMVKIVAFIIILVLVNSLLCYALEPVGGASDVMWSDYAKEEKLDIIYTGSSFCLRSFNPYVLDKELGTNSFNMGTPAQAIDQTYVAIKTALKEHELSTVVLALNYSSLETDWPVSSKVAFMRAKTKNESLTERIKDTISFVMDKDNYGECTSVNFFFPWIYNHVDMNLYSISKNIAARNSGVTKEEDTFVNDHKRKYIGKGFGYYIGRIDVNEVGNQNSRNTYYNEFSTAAFDVLRDIMALCNENKVELIVVNTPRPSFDVISFGQDYFVKYERLKQVISEGGAEYYDFNLVKPEIFELKDDYFVDYEHLNKEGSTAFSKAFAKFLKLRKENTDMDRYFYTKDEYLASIDYITNVYFDATVSEEGILLKANAYHGTNVEVEYEFGLWNQKTKEYIVLREYDEDNEFFYKPKKAGTYHFYVKARKIGTDTDYDRIYREKVEYEM